MTTLTGLPPLPRSLQGLFQGGSAHWKETERILQIRASIQQDISETQAQEWGGGGARNSLTNGNGSPAVGRRTTLASLQATLAQLRREMVSLRQLDMSLLCQLWSLNESIQEYKHLVGDRMSETNSECSNYSLENGLDTIPSIEEENDLDPLNSSLEDCSERLYQNADVSRTLEHQSRAPLTPPLKSQRSKTPPKQRPSVPPPAAPRPPDSPIPPPRTRTPPTKRSKPTLPHVPPPIARTPPGSLNHQQKTPPLPSNPPPINRTPSLPHAPPPVHRTPPPRNNTPPLPMAPPPVNRSTPTKRPSMPQAPPRRNRGTPPKNSQSSPSLSIRSSFSTTSTRSSAYGSDC